MSYGGAAEFWRRVNCGRIRLTRAEERALALFSPGMARMPAGLVDATKGSRKPFLVKPLKAEPPKPAAEGKAEKITSALIARIDAATSVASLEAITADDMVITQRGWMDEKRPDLAQRVKDALSARLADFDRTDADEGMPA